MKAKKPILYTETNKNISNLEDAIFYTEILKIIPYPESGSRQDIGYYFVPNTQYIGYYFVPKIKFTTGSQYKNIYISIKKEIFDPDELNIPIYIIENGTWTPKQEIPVYYSYGSQDIPSTIHKESLSFIMIQYSPASFYGLLSYTNKNDWKVYFVPLAIQYSSINSRFEASDTSQNIYSIETHSNCIYQTIYNYNQMIGNMTGREFLFCRYTSSESWIVSIVIITPSNQIYLADYTSFSLDKNTERLTRGYFRESTKKYTFLKLKNGETPTVYSYENGFSSEGSITGYTYSIENSPFGGYFFQQNDNNLTYIMTPSKTSINKNGVWYNLSLTKGGTFLYKNKCLKIENTIYSYKNPVLFKIDKDLYILREKTYYFQYTFQKQIYLLSEDFVYTVENPFILEIYYMGIYDYTPCKCIIQKKIFEVDSCYIEDESEPPKAIELYDDNDTLLFWGYSKEGYEFTPPKYNITYYSHWNTDLERKLNTSFTSKKVSEMISSILTNHCEFLYEGTIDTTTNTYTITEQRTIKEFLQWCAYIEQKIITIEPDGKLHFTSGIYNNGYPYQITIQDPKKRYKFSNIYPTEFYVIGGLYNGQRLYATQINDPNGDPFMYYATNVNSQSELNNILAKLVTMKSQQRLKIDFINYNDSALYPIGTIMELTDEEDTFIDGKQCIVTAVEHEPLYPDKTGYILYNSINYNQMQNQTEERITIIEQNQENIDNRVKTVEQGYRCIPRMLNRNDSDLTLWNPTIYSGSRVWGTFDLFNATWIRGDTYSGSTLRYGDSNHPRIPTNAKMITLGLRVVWNSQSTSNKVDIAKNTSTQPHFTAILTPTGPANYFHWWEATVELENGKFYISLWCSALVNADLYIKAYWV